MKIKRLHLRNIASVERADIDFDKDLADAATGLPASVFLISGDTGAGKTVLLDAIAMALYKKTPRIESVSNVKNNSFTDNDGRNVKLTDISQYTRLGCTAKDECYSELVFEGNDGAEYTARLTLGISNRTKKNDRTNKKVYDYLTPKWTVRRGNEAPITGDKDVEATILAAVGLTFEQFGRIAMLAQGQFATFLTGDRKEREAILEQLTNTERFTRYGDAVTSLYRKREAEFNDLKKECEIERAHVMTAEQEAEAKAQLAALETEAAQIKTAKETAEKTLGLVDRCLDRTKLLAELRAARAAVDRAMASDDFRNICETVAAWDATTDLRHTLADRKMAKAGLDNAVDRTAALEGTFTSLSAGLEAMRRQAEELAKAIDDADRRLGEQAPFAQLFEDAGATILQLQQLQQQRKAVKDKVAELSAAKALVPTLTHNLEQSRTSALNAIKTDREAADEIRRLTDERDAMKPAEINDSIDANEKRIKALERLRDDILSVGTARTELNAARGDADRRRTDQKSLEATAEAARKAADTAKSRREECADRLSTMQMSANEAIVATRERLRKGYTDTCPLCGSHFDADKLPLADSFAILLSPLEKELEEAKIVEDKAIAALNEACSAADKARGELAALQTDISHKEERISVLAKNISEQGKALRISESDLNEASLTALIDSLSGATSLLRQSRDKAQDLQKSIDRHSKHKQELERNRRKCENELKDKENELKNNNDRIKRLETEASSLAKSVAESEDALNKKIGAFMPTWQSDTGRAAEAIRDAAVKYSATVRKRDDDRQKHRELTGLIEATGHTRSEIIGLRPEWASLPAAAAAQATDPAMTGARWNRLFAEVTSLTNSIKTARETIGKCNEILGASVYTVERLEEIEAAKPRIDSMRREIADREKEQKSNTDAINRAENEDRTDRELLAGLCPDGTPARDELAATLNGLSVKADEISKQYGALQNDLTRNSVNSTALKALEAKLLVAQNAEAYWRRLNDIFGGTRFRTLVQTHILKPLLNNANIYLKQITDRYTLTCSGDNEQLSIFVLDNYNKGQVRSATVLSGGERFMVSLALSLALSSLNRPDMNVNILFIDEGFGTLGQYDLDSVMKTLESLDRITGGTGRRVGIISHREELAERIPVKILVEKHGEGRSRIRLGS